MYYDGANWKWDKQDDGWSLTPELSREIAEEYSKKLNHKGHEMKLRFIERDGKKILQQATDFGRSWEDVPCVVEKKEQRKLAEIMDKVAKPGHCWSFPELASAAIDAVIECYEEWIKIPVFDSKRLKPFPEYLKEKML